MGHLPGALGAIALFASSSLMTRGRRIPFHPPLGRAPVRSAAGGRAAHDDETACDLEHFARAGASLGALGLVTRGSGSADGTL